MKLNPLKNCTVEELQQERNYACEICGTRRGTEKHHAIFRRDVRYKEFDCVINYQLVCHTCHMMYADSRRNRSKHIDKTIERYGINEYEAWRKSLPIKIKNVGY